MQTYTHGAMGLIAGAMLYHNHPLAQAALVVGSIAPDLVMVPLFVLDKLQGRQPLANQGPWTITMKEISHSLPLAIILTIQPWWLAGKFIGVGMMVHTIIDGFTHGDNNKTDQSCLWPCHNHLPKLGTIVGFWNYSYGPGILRPKPAEAMIDLICIAIWIWFTWL